jgi:hypothetical protein
MRKITQQAAQAFKSLTPFKSGNTEVKADPVMKIAFLVLHGHVIAEKQNDLLFIDSCGYRTNTTKERPRWRRHKPEQAPMVFKW